MAPEQILGQPDKICAQTDVWALGIMAHRMLVGSEPWTAKTLPHLVAQIAYEPIPAPSDRGSSLGAAFDAWFSRCCARDTADRFPSATAAINALATALGQKPVLSRSSTDLERQTARERQRSAANTAFAATAVAGSSLGSDTLSAQVAPHKGPHRVVLALIVALVLGLLGAGLFVALRTTPVQGEPSPAARAPASESPVPPASIAPLVEPTVAPAATGVGSTSAPEAPSAAPSARLRTGGKAPGKPSSSPPATTSDDPLNLGRK
jgi:serine/threonine-protein kinase